VQAELVQAELERVQAPAQFHDQTISDAPLLREIYDVGSDTPITMLDLAEQIKRENNSRSKIVINKLPDAVPAYLPRDTRKTIELLERI
jgi:hypothetical protein